MNKTLWLIVSLSLVLMSCVDFDESTYITDDLGMVHHTKHHSRDYRGRHHFPKKISSAGEKRFIFDPKVAAWAAYDAEGNRLLTGGASGGKDFCEDIGEPCRTISGTFRVFEKKDLDCQSHTYPIDSEGGGAKMPYCMYFYRGFTIHAAFEVPSYNSSHGCVRVLPSAAKWLNEEFIDIGTQVTVLSYENDEDDEDDIEGFPDFA